MNNWYVFISAIHQDEDDGLDDNQVRSPFGSSFRTFDGTDYSSIGNYCFLTVFITAIFNVTVRQVHLKLAVAGHFR